MQYNWLFYNRILAEQQAQQEAQQAVEPVTKPVTKPAIPNNQPPPPSFLGCLFGWLGPLRGKKDTTLAVDKEKA